MGYPVTYRTSEARAERRLRGFQGANDNVPRDQRGTTRARTRAGVRVNYFGSRPLPSNPLTLAARQRNQRALFGALKGGLRLRSLLLRTVARWAVRRLIDRARHQSWTETPGTAKHPLWTVTAGGRWGTYPFCSNQTGAHTVGSAPLHSSGPLVFGHPNGAFSWCEYDTVTKPSPGFWQFVVVGRGNQNAGPTAAAFYGAMQQTNPFPDSKYRPAYNPSWNRMPGRWPQNMPRPRTLPMPMDLDPFAWPPYSPEPPPMPMPYPLIPHLRPNPYRSPHEQTQRGPFRVRFPRPEPIITPTWPDVITPPVVEPWTPPVTEIYPPQIRDRFEPGKPRVRERVKERDRPPGRKVKEKKSKVSQRMAKLLLAAINGLTEFNDFVAALYKALPKKYQRRGILIKDKWAMVYRHWDELNLEHAVRAVLRNQIEDAIYGRMGSAGGKGARARGDVIDKVSRNLRKIQSRDNQYGPGGRFQDDPVDWVLDRMFGKDT